MFPTLQKIPQVQVKRDNANEVRIFRRVGALPLFPRTMLFHRQLCSSNSHWCACLISQNHSITRPYLFCEKQVFTFPKRSLGFKTVTSGQLAYTFLIRILSTSSISVSIFSVCCCYSRVSSMVVTLCHSPIPCDDTPTAATLALTTGGVPLRPCTARASMESQNEIFCK